MSKLSVPAAAEGALENQSRSLTEVIDAYYAGMEAYRVAPRFTDIKKEEEFCAQAYGWALRLLEAWNAPAESAEEAIWALRLASLHAGDHDTASIAVPMVKAAIGYFEKREDESSSNLLEGLDRINEAESFLDLVGYALEGMEATREINALQYGLIQSRRALVEAEEAIERFRNET